MAAPVVASVLASAGKTAGAILRNKWFWIALIVIILILVARKYWHVISRWFQPTDIDLEPGESVKIESGREAELKGVAAELYSDLYDTPASGHNNQLYSNANKLSDNELKFLAKYYRQNLTQGTYLYTDIDEDWFNPFTNVDSMLMAHLAKVGEKGA